MIISYQYLNHRKSRSCTFDERVITELGCIRLLLKTMASACFLMAVFVRIFLYVGLKLTELCNLQHGHGDL